MQGFVCPKCYENLILSGKSLVCSNNHCFDISKSGYVNLLQNNQSSSKRHGDDKLMVKARTDFLNNGYYDKLIFTVANLVNKYSGENPVVLDAGCGECKYTDEVEKMLSSNCKSPVVLGVDISKEAVNFGAKRNKKLNLAVASISKLPIANKSVDLVLNIFAPSFPQEFARILNDNGYLIKVIPLENHLIELKQAIYDVAYKNEIEDSELDGFSKIEAINLEYVFDLYNNQDIKNLFMMTPYYYKTSIADQKKLDNIEKLSVTAQFQIIVYKIKNSAE